MNTTLGDESSDVISGAADLPAWSADEMEPGQRPANAAVRALTVLWPAFAMAGVLEMLVFAVVDPGELRWFGGELIAWPRQAIYTVTFLIFWGVISTASGLSALLAHPADEGRVRGLARRWP